MGARDAVGIMTTPGESTQLDPGGGAAWDPTADSWSPLPDPPVVLERGTTVSTGEELVVFGLAGLQGPAGIAYDPVGEEWRLLAKPEVRPAAAVWTGQDVLVVDFDNTRTAATYDPAEDEWHPLPDVPLPAQEGISSVHMVDDIPVLWSYPGAAALLDGEWYPLATPDTDPHVVACDGVLWVGGFARPASSQRMTLSSFQPPASTDEIPGSVLTIGFSSLRVPDDFVLDSVDASQELIGDGVASRVLATLTAQRGTCEVISRFGPPGDGETIDIEPINGGESFDAVRVAPGRIDFTEPRTPRHALEINCQEPADAEHLARHIVPTADVRQP